MQKIQENAKTKKEIVNFGLKPYLSINKLVDTSIGLATMGVFFCDSLDLCYDPCHVIKHKS